MPDVLDEEVQTTFDISCAFCQAFIPIMIQTDPDTGEGLSLLGECNARHNVGACPAGQLCSRTNARHRRSHEVHC
jgi:hypothetical protein